ncbi:MAG: hypothetical protein MJY64_03135 [archaeon]|nr:hypothetical protein [archaeon]
MSFLQLAVGAGAPESCGHGVFTELFLGALKGENDLFGNMTLGNVYAYVDKALGPWDQRPTFKANVDCFVPLRRRAICSIEGPAYDNQIF